MSTKQYLSTSLAGLSLALLMSVWAPSATAQTAANPFGCSCMCMEGSPRWICSAGFSTNEPASCQETQCPAVSDAGGETGSTGGTQRSADNGSTGSTGSSDAPAGDVAGSGAVVEPPVAQDGSTMSGLECRMRKIYRPDLGRYKRHKVCRLTPERRAELRERLAQLGERHESAIERLRAKHERREARRAERRAARAERRAQRRAAEEETGDDD